MPSLYYPEARQIVLNQFKNPIIGGFIMSIYLRRELRCNYCRGPAGPGCLCRVEQAMREPVKPEAVRLAETLKKLSSPGPAIGTFTAREPVLIRSKPKKSFWEKSLEDRYPSLRF